MLNPSITIYIKKTAVIVGGVNLLRTCCGHRFNACLWCLVCCWEFSSFYTLINNLKLYLNINNILPIFERSYL